MTLPMQPTPTRQPPHPQTLGLLLPQHPKPNRILLAQRTPKISPHPNRPTLQPPQPARSSLFSPGKTHFLYSLPRNSTRSHSGSIRPVPMPTDPLPPIPQSPKCRHSSPTPRQPQKSPQPDLNPHPSQNQPLPYPYPTRMNFLVHPPHFSPRAYFTHPPGDPSHLRTPSDCLITPRAWAIIWGLPTTLPIPVHTTRTIPPFPLTPG